MIAMKDKRFLIATPIYGRFDLFEKFVKNNSKYADIMAVGSQGDVSRSICEKLGVAYAECPNQPFGRKLNERVRYFLKNKQYSHIIFLGSDNLIDDNYFNAINREVDEGWHCVSWKDIYFYDYYDEKCLYWKGYTNSPREGEPLAPGRCMSRALITQLSESDGELWPEDVKIHPDGHVWKNKVSKIRSHKILSLKDENALIVDIKKDINITSFSTMRSMEGTFEDHIVGEKIKKILGELEK
jgi:hypothetical protein